MTMKLGINLAPLSNHQRAYLNLVKTGMGWQTYHAGSDTGEEVALYQNYLDANGYPTTVAPGGARTFTEVGIPLLFNTDPFFYPAGNYVFLYDGTGTFAFTSDFAGTPVSSTPGRIVINVVPTGSGTIIKCTSTGTAPSNAQNWRLVYSPDSTGSVIGVREALLNNGEIFAPEFIDKMKSFDTIRFMDWMGTIQNFQKDWTDRPLVAWPFYGDSRTNATINGNFANPFFGGMYDGTPAEVMIALCNKIGANPWFNMPPLATDAYVTAFATLAHSLLNPSLKAYVEYANELWNERLGPASGTMTKRVESQVSDLCLVAYPYRVGAGFSDFQLNTLYHSLRCIQVGKLWQTAWGADAGRVVRIFGGWAGNSGYNSDWLPWTDPGPNGDGLNKYYTGTVAANVDKLSVAPYFAYGFPNTWNETAVFTEFLQGGLDDLSIFTLGDPLGMVHQAISFVTTCKAQAVAAGIGLVCYEGGQQFAAGSDPKLIALFTSVFRDARMFGTMMTYYNGCQAAGAELLCHYSDISPLGQPPAGAFFWGLWEHVDQVRSMRGDATLQFTTPNRHGNNFKGGF